MPFFVFSAEDYAAWMDQIGQDPGIPRTKSPDADLPLWERPIRHAQELSKAERTAGRRFRTWKWFPRVIQQNSIPVVMVGFGAGTPTINQRDPDWTYGDLYQVLDIQGDVHDYLSAIPLRSAFGSGPKIYEIPEGPVEHKRDPELHSCLQDLGWLLGWELSQACQALTNPAHYYPGVDDGSIEPVSDDHVRLVIWGAQRELDRERRPLSGHPMSLPRPAAPLAELPFRVQRAYAERRRWHYAQYGIGRDQYERGAFSFFDIQEDPEWVPPWIIDE